MWCVVHGIEVFRLEVVELEVFLFLLLIVEKRREGDRIKGRKNQPGNENIHNSPF